jgi:hypothetical protein
LEQNGNQMLEKETAGYFSKNKNLKGIDPMQARNVLQMLGLTRYEIPIDSRITKWINEELHYPVKLTATALSDNEYYDFVMDGIQAISSKAVIEPCLLDAAIFASYDGDALNSVIQLK